MLVLLGNWFGCEERSVTKVARVSLEFILFVDGADSVVVVVAAAVSIVVVTALVVLALSLVKAKQRTVGSAWVDNTLVLHRLVGCKVSLVVNVEEQANIGGNAKPAILYGRNGHRAGRDSPPLAGYWVELRRLEAG